MERIIFLVDGFNLYHSLLAAKALAQRKSVKWLDLSSLCKSHLYLLGKDARLEKIYYFSALAEHRLSKDPDTTNRHNKLLTCLRSTGIEVELSTFKPREIRARRDDLYVKFIRYEEKETDVAIASKLLELLHLNAGDIFVLLTGDTDLVPAVRTVQNLFNSKRILFAFPFKRWNQTLETVCPGSFKIGYKQYINHQFPDVVNISDSETVEKPGSW